MLRALTPDKPDLLPTVYMNEAILKWLASGTIGVVICASLWLAGTVQQGITGVVLVGTASGSPAPAPHRRDIRDIRLAAAPAERAASAIAVRTAFVLN